MKKIIVGAAVIALCLIIYFVCGSPDDESKKNLLMDSPPEESAEAVADQERGPDDGGRDGEVKEDREQGKKAAENSIVFFVSTERAEYSFPAIGNFRKMSATSEMTGYVANFAVSREAINVPDQSRLSQVISILLPGDAGPGSYNEKSANFMVQFFGREAGVLYNLDYNCPFSLTIDEWGGPGGRVRGTFSGELKADGSSTVINVSDGRFDAGIQ